LCPNMQPNQVRLSGLQKHILDTWIFKIR
jgi:hypothetical protein